MEVHRADAVGGRGLAEGKYIGNITSQGIKSSHEVAVVTCRKRGRLRNRVREYDGME